MSLAFPTPTMRTYSYNPSLGAILATLFSFVMARRVRHIAIEPHAVSVLDGDTIRVAATTYRLAGLDTPEVFTPRCANERELGRHAMQALTTLIHQSASLSVEIIQLDRYERTVARLSIDGVDAADLMIGFGHGRPYDGHSKRHAWCTCSTSKHPC